MTRPPHYLAVIGMRPPHNFGSCSGPVNIAIVTGQVFSKENENESSNSNKKIWRTNGLRTGVLLGVISNMHRVHINLEDPMDVRNDLQQGNCFQAVCFSHFFMRIWGVISILFEKT